MVTWDTTYTPTLDDQTLINELEIMVGHQLRWSSIYSLLKSRPFDMAAEALICNMAFHDNLFWRGIEMDDFFTRMYIYILGWDLAPYAMYRKDKPPIGKWSPLFGNFADRVPRRYKEVCERILKASEAEILRD